MLTGMTQLHPLRHRAALLAGLIAVALAAPPVPAQTPPAAQENRPDSPQTEKPDAKPQQKPSIGVCMTEKERLDLSLLTMGREVAIFLQRCLADPAVLTEKGRKAADKVMSVTRERKKLLEGAGAHAKKAFKRSSLGGEQLFVDFITAYSGSIEREIIKDGKVDPSVCAEYFDFMGAVLTGPDKALQAVVIFRAERFSRLFPACQATKEKKRQE